MITVTPFFYIFPSSVATDSIGHSYTCVERRGIHQYFTFPSQISHLIRQNTHAVSVNWRGSMLHVKMMKKEEWNGAEKKRIEEGNWREGRWVEWRHVQDERDGRERRRRGGGQTMQIQWGRRGERRGLTIINHWVWSAFVVFMAVHSQ